MILGLLQFYRNKCGTEMDVAEKFGSERANEMVLMLQWSSNEVLLCTVEPLLSKIDGTEKNILDKGFG